MKGFPAVPHPNPPPHAGEGMGGGSSGAAGGCCGSRAATNIYGKPGSVVRLSIPIHGNRPLKTGLLRHLAKLVEDELN